MGLSAGSILIQITRRKHSEHSQCVVTIIKCLLLSTPPCSRCPEGEAEALAGEGPGPAAPEPDACTPARARGTAPGEVPAFEGWAGQGRRAAHPRVAQGELVRRRRARGRWAGLDSRPRRGLVPVRPGLSARLPFLQALLWTSFGGKSLSLGGTGRPDRGSHGAPGGSHPWPLRGSSQRG